MDKVDAKCFQHTTIEMKINLGLKYSLVSPISNSICLHSTRIYAPFQPDKNLILGNKALQIEFKGRKKNHSIFQLFPELHNYRLQLKNRESCHYRSRADTQPLDTVAVADIHNKNQY